MKVGLDVMGGDFAPDATIDGAILAHKEIDASDRIVLIGSKELILAKLNERGCDAKNFDIAHASEVIGMGESPIKALKVKSDSSLAVGFGMLKNDQIQALASAGNTGAMLVGSIFSVNNVQGIIRPATSVLLPKENGGNTILIDVGTNPDARPDVMYQFGILGSLYAEKVHNISNPRVGLLNIGEEEGKGNLLSQSTFRLMKDSRDFNFYGNIESREIFGDKVDVIVCDGFTGNVVLKQMEAMFQMLCRRNLQDDYIKRFNYENFGGSPILGVNGSVIIGHGISSAEAIKKMIILARDVYVSDLPKIIQEALT